VWFAVPCGACELARASCSGVVLCVGERRRRAVSWIPQTLEEIKDRATVVVDTNALLVPYGTGKAGLAEVGKTYKSLVEEKRLCIPGQVVREFAFNRVVKLQELHQQLTRKKEKLLVARGTYPLLEGFEAYSQMCSLESKRDKLIEEYRRAIDSVLGEVRGWYWNNRLAFCTGISSRQA